MADPVLNALRSIVGGEHLLVDDDVRRGYEVDWTGRFRGTSVAVLRPASTSEVGEVVRTCLEHDVTIVTQGGNTGLVGGGVPRPAAVDGRRTVVLSMRRFDQLGPVDAGAMQVTAGAAVTLAAWRQHARSSSLDTPVDFAARDSATIGGAIATNAGGSRVLRFGTMRQQVVGVRAVLGNGEIVGSVSGLPKETTGLHWPSVLAGSEGTLAVVTEARLRLVPWFRHSITALVTTTSLDDAVMLLGRLRRLVPSLDSTELIQPGAMRLVTRHLGADAPLAAPDGGSYVMIECADHTDPSDQLLDALGSAGEVVDAVVTIEPPQRERLVQFRDRITEAIAAASTAIGTPTFKLDVAVPVDALGELVASAQAAADDDGAELISFGHLAEGNVHLNHIGAGDPDRIASSVLTKVAELGGTISAEHGVGVAKREWLHLIRSPADLAAQRAIKAALDPGHILNPGVLLPQVP